MEVEEDTTEEFRRVDRKIEGVDSIYDIDRCSNDGYKELLDAIWESDRQDFKIKFISGEWRGSPCPIVVLDCAHSGRASIVLEGFEYRGEGFPLNEYNYKNKEQDLLSLQKAIRYAHEMLTAKYRTIEANVKKNEETKENKRTKAATEAATEATKTTTDNLYKIDTAEPKNAQTVNSIIFQLCEATRMEPCFKIAKEINESRGANTRKLSELEGYVNYYGQCYKFIHGVSLQDIGPKERVRLTDENFKIYKKHEFLKKNFSQDEKRKQEYKNIIKHMKNFLETNLEKINKERSLESYNRELNNKLLETSFDEFEKNSIREIIRYIGSTRCNRKKEAEKDESKGEFTDKFKEINEQNKGKGKGRGFGK